MITYSVLVGDPFGNPLNEISNFVDPPEGGGSSLEYVLNVGNVGVLQMTVPLALVDPRIFMLDGRLLVNRSIDGRQPKPDGQAAYLIRKWKYTESVLTVTAYHANSLLQRRIIAYFTNTPYTKKASTFAGNLIKVFARENLGASISPANRIGDDSFADISTLLSIATDAGDGATLSAQDSFRNLYDLIKDLTDASTQNNSYLAAEVVAPTARTLELRTFKTARGTDRREGTSGAVILSPDFGTLTNCVLEIDRSQEVTYAVCGGSGKESARLTAFSMDAQRINESPFNRMEVFGDYSNISNQSALQAKADALVYNGRPKLEFSADIVETDGATRGIHYDLGDLVTAKFLDQKYSCRLDVIGVSVANGEQKSTGRVRYAK